MSDRHKLLSRETLCILDKGTIDLTTVQTVHDDGREHVISEPIWADRDSIAVLPYDAEKKTVLLVRQMRTAVYLRDQALILEACAGGIEATDASVEEACRREAEEELGVSLDALEKVGQVFINPARMVEKANLFLAPYQSGQQHPEDRHQDEDEDIEVVEVSTKTIKKWLDEGNIRCPRLLILAQALMSRHANVF
ncbi:NUDIX domain-containing protein [Cohaesibacter marisflavi]|uniref:GDP-mannose pyrophosphatase n=1 Tax=Cohaesibacter marisflavi TaxID=655353 RepID=A0A1I5K6V5_9HYPH|nr:NUDIX domain-containing protein [Cohaesibacter marisflavi]SFO80785.1 NUDIX domain-containing protein [Cohaesibacter marisflavi]